MRNLNFRGFLTLIRYKVSLAVAFSACPAIVLARGSFLWSDLLPLLGILLLASGASALNQVQERKYDAKMARTAGRPLPSSDISPHEAILTASVLIAGGLLSIAAGKHYTTLILGIFTLLWYNGFYTILKRITAFAVVPGALTGAIPVMMGWTAAGGHITDPLPLFLAFFIFLWQVPHFWLLALIHEKDYRNAGFPVLTDLFSPSWMKVVIFSWLVAASLASLLMILFGILNNLTFQWLILLMNAILLAFSGYNLFVREAAKYRLLFQMINLFMFLVFAVIIIDHL